MIIRSSDAASAVFHSRNWSECSNTLTNCAPCNRSRGVGKVISDTAMKAPVFRVSDQTTACTVGSRPSIPNSACGRSQPMPQGPSASNVADIAPPGPKLGRSEA